MRRLKVFNLRTKTATTFISSDTFLFSTLEVEKAKIKFPFMRQNNNNNNLNVESILRLKMFSVQMINILKFGLMNFLFSLIFMIYFSIIGMDDIYVGWDWCWAWDQSGAPVVADRPGLQDHQGGRPRTVHPGRAAHLPCRPQQRLVSVVWVFSLYRMFIRCCVFPYNVIFAAIWRS